MPKSKKEMLRSIKTKLIQDSPTVTTDEVSLIDELMGEVTGVPHQVDPWCLICVTHGHTESPPRHDNRRRQMDLATAQELLNQYELDPYERVEGTWIGAGKQMFYRDRMSGELHTRTDGHGRLGPEEVQGLKDIEPLEAKAPVVAEKGIEVDPVRVQEFIEHRHNLAFSLSTIQVVLEAAGTQLREH